MDEEARYWKIKWEESQKEIMALKSVLKNEFEWLNSNQINKLIREEKQYGKQRSTKK